MAACWRMRSNSCTSRGDNAQQACRWKHGQRAESDKCCWHTTSVSSNTCTDALSCTHVAPVQRVHLCLSWPTCSHLGVAQQVAAGCRGLVALCAVWCPVLGPLCALCVSVVRASACFDSSACFTRTDAAENGSGSSDIAAAAVGHTCCSVCWTTRSKVGSCVRAAMLRSPQPTLPVSCTHQGGQQGAQL